MQGQSLEIIDGETRLIRNDWTQYAEKAGATISSSEWRFDGEGTLADAAISGLSVSVKLSPIEYGTLVNTVVLSNGEILVNYRFIDVP